MNADNSTPLDEQFTAWLVACHEALEAGSEPPSTVVGGIAPELKPRLERGLACLRLLRRFRSRDRDPNGSTETEADPEPGAGSSLPWTSLGRFRILRELGRGGCGIVFLAYDPRLDRQVALKVPRAEVAVTPGLPDRFQREARVAAGLDHPNLVPVYEVGEVGPVCFLISAYCPGVTLAEWLKTRMNPVPFRVAAELMVTLTEAVGHAHGRGVVHRDLKPSNVILQPIPEPPPRGREAGSIVPALGFIPRVTDFGLAMLLSGKDGGPAPGGQTRTGAVLGTAGYMAPEQAAGEPGEIGPAADLYALGVILYEMLTGRPPFQGESDLETLLHLQTHDPVPPARLRPKVPRDLETICLKCLEKEPARRYPGAGALGDDLRRYLDDCPILARRPTHLERGWRWCRRNPLPSSLAATVAALLLLLVAGSIVSVARLRRDHDRLVGAERAIQKELVRSLVSQARAAHRSGLPGRRYESLDALSRAIRLRSTFSEQKDLPTLLEMRNEAVACLALADMRVASHWGGYPAGSTRVTFDAGFERYARAHGDGTIRLARVARDEEIAILQGLPGQTKVLRFSPDGRFLAIKMEDGRLQIWDLERRELLPHDLGAVCDNALDFHPDGRQLAVGHFDGTISLFDLGKRRTTRRIPQAGHPLPLHLAFRPDGRKIAVCNQGLSTVLIRDTGGDEVIELTHSNPIWDIAWSGSGELLAAACEDFGIHVWEVASQRKRLLLLGHEAQPVQIAFSPRDDLLASSGDDSTIRLWDVQSGRQLFRTTASIGDIRFSRDGRWLGWSVKGTELGLWQVSAGSIYRTITPEVDSGQGRIDNGSISPNGERLAVAMSDGVRIYDLARREELAYLEIGPTSSAIFGPSGNELITGSVRGLHRWPIHVADDDPALLGLGPPRQTLRDETGQIGAAADGRLMAVAVLNRGGLVLRMDETAEKGPLLPHPGAVFAAISPDGRWVATSTWHGRGVEVWDARKGSSVTPRLLPREASITICFSPDGNWLVTSTPHEYCFWRAGVWRPVRRLDRDGAQQPGHVAFSPEGRIAALETLPGRIQLLEPETWRELATLEQPEMHRASRLAFSPDGSRLVAISAVTRQIHLWDLHQLRAQLADMGLDWDRSRPTVASGSLMAPRRRRIQVELDAELYVARAKRHARLNAFGNAVADYEEALKQDPEHPVASNDLAWLLAAGPPEVRNVRRALRLAQKAVALHENDPSFLNTLGVVYYRDGQWGNAVAALQAAIRANERVGGSAWDLFFLAMAHHRLGNRSQARACFDKAVQWCDRQKALTPQDVTELTAFRTEAEAVLAGPGGELPVDLFAPE